MAESNQTSAAPRRRRGLRLFGWVAGGFLLLLVVAYFIITSAPFLNRVVLPRLSDSLNSDVTVRDAVIRPFSEVILHDLKVQPRGKEPLLTAAQVRARYSLIHILTGTIDVQEAVLISPTIHIIEQPDGTSNLDPLLQAIEDSDKKKERTPKQPSEPAQIQLGNLVITNAVIRKERLYAEGTRDLAEMSGANLTLSNFRNGDSGKLALNSDILIQNNPPAPGTNGTLRARISGQYVFALSPQLEPISIKGDSLLHITDAQGAYVDLLNLNANVTADVAPTEVTELALRFKQNGNSLGQVRVSGPFDLQNATGNLHVEVLSIDKQVLNLFGAPAGVDFGTTVLNSTNTVSVAESGSVFSIAGLIRANNVQVTQAGKTTPSLDFQASYDLTANLAASNAVVRALTLRGSQNGQGFLSGELTSPMPLAWGTTTESVGDSSFNLSVTNFNVAEWKPFLGDSLPAAIAGLDLRLTSQRSGSELTFALASRLSNLSGMVGDMTISHADIEANARGEVRDLQQLSLRELRLDMMHRRQPVATLAGSGTYDTTAETAEMQLAGRASLPGMLSTLGGTNGTASSGAVELDARLTRKGGSQSIVGKLALSDFTGRWNENRFSNYNSTVEMDLAMVGEEVRIQKLQGIVSESGRPGGRFELSGSHNGNNGTASLNARFSDLNQNGLRPFLEPLFEGKRIESILLNGTAAVDYSPSEASKIKADVKLSNLVVTDARQTTPGAPLEAQLQLDASVRNQVAELRELRISLSPTERASNRLQVTGRMDFSKSDAITGNLAIASEALDVTRYYDLFEAEEQESAKVANTPATAAADAPAPAEPEPVQLPVSEFRLTTDLKRLFLREVDIGNFRGSVHVRGSRVTLDPTEFTLNGAPVKAAADIDLGVTGYRYALSGSARRVPVAPLANSFAKDYRGRAQGELIADVNIKGAGTTGASLRESLEGHASLVFTNANIQLVGRTLRPILVVIGTALRVPEIANSPVSWLDANLAFGEGRITLQQFQAAGPAFAGTSQGTVRIARVLTNSPIQNIPVNFALSQSLANRAGFRSSGTNAYVDLGTVAHIRGTLGDPDPKVDYARLALITGQMLGGAAPGAGTNIVGGLLQGLLGGRNVTSTNAPPAPATNSPPATRTNENRSGTILDLLPRNR